MPELKRLAPALEYDQVVQAFFRGGYPEPVLADSDVFYKAWMENYFQTYLQRDIRKLFPRLVLFINRRTGNNFEAFIIEELIKGFQADNVESTDYYYYRTKNGV